MGAGALAIVAGGGALPVMLAGHMRASGEPYFVIRLSGLTDPALDAHPGQDCPLHSLQGLLDAASGAGCARLVMAGLVTRADLGAGAPDARWLQALAASGGGDDALVRALISAVEAEGMTVVGADAVMEPLRAPAGPMGAVSPSEADLKDIALARRVAEALGALDVGQGAVVCAGLTLAVEAQEGTDRMLARVAELPAGLRGTPEARRGVLVKTPKPGQELRVDMPTVGVRTVEGAAHAGLAGIAVQAGGCLVLDRAAVAEAADAAGLFLYGFEAEQPDAG